MTAVLHERSPASVSAGARAGALDAHSAASARTPSRSPACHAAGVRAGVGPLAPARPLCSRDECWAERHIARRDAARAFLTSKGLRPQRRDREAEVPAWIVPGWTSTFTDGELVELARHHGWEG